MSGASNESQAFAAGAGLFGAVIAGLYIVYSGFVVMCLWNWFVPLIWQGSAPITLPIAIGLDLLVSAVTPTPVGTHKGMAALNVLVTKPTLLLCLGWLVHQFA